MDFVILKNNGYWWFALFTSRFLCLVSHSRSRLQRRWNLEFPGD
jgi:hypothetical protein